ncbi:hypothetical protein R3X25_10570 [Lutibacter sp. TH_r2]|uniref:SEL1-like repeat protein n=1 Tax=Lutibacter sp. TH_r2 TaxID=3082083 RepID=UPI002955CF0F|nr:hypothetical protein [Lutibacter sp. TH_r2]MDV7187725.1 hypothetical protein [Lutibacter sp. TH_r2]
MIRSILICILFMLLQTNIISAQNSLAKIEYSYAEEAYSNNNYKKALEHLEEVKSLLGSTNARVMYLEIMALSKMFSVAKNTLEDYIIYKKLDNLTSSYLINFENDVPIEKIKTVYEIQKEYKVYAIEAEHLMKGKTNQNEKNYDDALIHYSKACEAGNPEACKNLANVYVLKKDFDNAKKFNEKAMDLGSIDAKFNKGLYLYYGVNGYSLEKSRGFRLIEETYNSGFLWASGILGVHYLSSDRKRAKELFDFSYKHMKQNNSAFYLSYYFNLVDTDVLKAAEEAVNNWLEDNPNSGLYNHYKGHLLYDKGQYPQAFKYYETACRKGHAFSCNFVGNIYFKKISLPSHEQYGITRDKKKGKEFKRKACALDLKYCD